MDRLRAENRLEGQPLVGPAPDELLEDAGHALDLGCRLARRYEWRAHVSHDTPIVAPDVGAEDDARLAASGYREGVAGPPPRPAEEGHRRTTTSHLSVADDSHDLAAV